MTPKNENFGNIKSNDENVANNIATYIENNANIQNEWSNTKKWPFFLKRLKWWNINENEMIKKIYIWNKNTFEINCFYGNYWSFHQMT